MPVTLQTFLADETLKGVTNLETAFNHLPADKRNWSPAPSARTGADMVAEVTLLNGVTAQMIEKREFPPDFEMGDFVRAKAELAQDLDALHALLQINTMRVVEAIRAVPDADLQNQMPMPWGMFSLAEIISYPYWNSKYHEGQINYIASILGCLNEPG